jgi:hypothetical protein
VPAKTASFLVPFPDTFSCQPRRNPPQHLDLGPDCPAPPSGPWGSRADRIALAVADLGQQGPARTNPTCRRWVECVQSRRLLGLVVAPRATRRNFVRFGDPPFSRALAASPPSIRLAAGNRRNVGFVSAQSRQLRWFPLPPGPWQTKLWVERITAPSRAGVWSRRRIGVRGRSLQNRRPGSR